MYNTSERLLIAFKWCASFVHLEWKLRDYPVRTRRNGVGAQAGQEWLAQILNWPGLGGVGGTPEEAIAKLSENLESAREYRKSTGERMPRPGSSVPIQFASTDRVQADPVLQDEFISRILGFSPGSPVFISDQSSLEDFGDEAYVSELQRRIGEVYGVDVSDLKGGLLCEIFERIRTKG